MAVDPRFSTNQYIYIYYTFSKHGVCPVGDPTNPENPVNRVARYKLSDANRATFDKVLIDNIPSPNGNHNAGDLQFGKDGHLYVSVGDGGSDYRGDSGSGGANDASRDRNVLLGKILRVTRDGDIPATNPFTGQDSRRCNVAGHTAEGFNCQETYAWGLRNPFRMAFDPNAAGTRFFVNDVGQNAYEEVDRGKAGADYGWNLCEGRHDNPGRPGSVDCASAPYTPPVHEYGHDSGCSSITGGAFVPKGLWPATYDRLYLYGDYVCGKIFELTPKSGGGYSRSEFVTGLERRSAVALAFGPFGERQALYYTTYANGGEVRRIAYTGAPTAALRTTSPNYGPTPLTVGFDGGESRDPNGDPLTYLWDFGDGATDETTTPTTSHTYTTEGPYTATLRVREGSGAISDPATVRVYPGNTPPSPQITAPTTDLRFKVGQEITAQGSATDAEDAAAPALGWEVIRHHNGDHTHPYKSGTGASLTFRAPPPEDLLATGTGNYLELRLTATDSQGLSRTVTQRLGPKRVNLRFETAPVDLKLRIEGTSVSTPRTLVSWWGYRLGVEAFKQQDSAGRVWVFESWSDGGAASHVITTPSGRVYTATFKRATG